MPPLPSQIEYLVKVGCVRVLCNLLMDGTMVMIALEGLEKILQVGEDVAHEHEGINVHAEHVDIKRLQLFKVGGARHARAAWLPRLPYWVKGRAALLSSHGLAWPLTWAPTLRAVARSCATQQNHKFGAVGRKAARLWKRHFVTCAICNSAFAKNTRQAKFCGECNCFVCSTCDCTVFHLSYQQDLWDKVRSPPPNTPPAKPTARRPQPATHYPPHTTTLTHAPLC